MKKAFRKYWMGVMILATTMSLTGCVNVSQGKKQAAEALGQKYQEEFEITAFREEGLLEDYYTVQAYSAAYPDLLFQATVDQDGKVSDSYVTRRLCDRISDKISRNLGSLETDYYVYTEAMISGTVITDPEVSLEDYLRESPANQFIIYLGIDKEGATVENMTAAMKNMMNGLTGLRGSVSVFLTDQKLLTQMQDYVTSHDDTYKDFDELMEASYIGYLDVEDGSISLTEDRLRKMAGDRL